MPVGYGVWQIVHKNQKASQQVLLHLDIAGEFGDAEHALDCYIQYMFWHLHQDTDVHLDVHPYHADSCIYKSHNVRYVRLGAG